MAEFIGLAASLITLLLFSGTIADAAYQMHKHFGTRLAKSDTFKLDAKIELIQKYFKKVVDFRKKDGVSKRLGEIADECLKIASNLTALLRKADMNNILSGRKQPPWIMIRAWFRKNELQRLQTQLHKNHQLIHAEINSVASTLKDKVSTVRRGDRKQQNKLLDLTIRLSNIDFRQSLTSPDVQKMIREQEKILGIERPKGA